MIPSEKYGDEFRFDRLILTFSDGRKLVRHQACVCITAKQDKESTLIAAWQVVHEVAKWLIESYNFIPEDESFQIIIAWSLRVRPHQGHIFKIRGFKGLLQQILSCDTYQQFVQMTGTNMTPMPRWEKDVFPNE